LSSKKMGEKSLNLQGGMAGAGPIAVAASAAPPEAPGLLPRQALQADELLLVAEVRGEPHRLGEAELDQPGIDEGPLLGEDVGEEAALAVPRERVLLEADAAALHEAQVPVLGSSRPVVFVRVFHGLAELRRGDPDGFFDDVVKDRDARRICGLAPLYTQLELLRGRSGRLLKYDIAMEPDTGSAVSFASLAID